MWAPVLVRTLRKVEDTLPLLPNKPWFHAHREHVVTSSSSSSLSSSSRRLSYDRSIASYRILLAVGANASSFNFLHYLIFSKSSSSCLRLLPRHSVTLSNKIAYIFVLIYLNYVKYKMATVQNWLQIVIQRP